MTVERSRLVILGIDEEGLGGLTDRARRILADADVIVGTPADPGCSSNRCRAQKVVLEPEMSKRARAGEGVAARPAAGPGQQRRPAVLWRCALSLRPTGQGLASRSCRTSAACNWHSHGSRRAGKTPT